MPNDRQINEGGTSGHLAHLFDNRDLTFGELKSILTDATEGRLEKVSEKLDGQNLSFSWDSHTNDLRAARNSGDLKSGGMDVLAIAKKFYGRGNVEKAFTTAFTILRKSLTALSDDEKIEIFGLNTNFWYPIEIIFTENPNVIVYDRNNLVFHMSPIISVDDEGNISRNTTGESRGFQKLVDSVERMQAAVDQNDWKINGPRMLQLKKLSNGDVLDRALGQIDTAMSEAGVNDGDTIETYLHNRVLDDGLSQLNVSDDVKYELANYILDIPNAGLNSIKKMVPKTEVDKVREIAKAKNDILKEYIRPIEVAIHELAVEVLKGLKSTLIDDSDREVARLRSEVSSAISALKSSGDDAAMTVLQTQMEKLGDVENIAAAMEGIVFIIRGQAYKLTGAFAPANQILGLFKYGRGSVKAMSPQAESIDREYIRLRRAVDRLQRSFRFDRRR